MESRKFEDHYTRGENVSVWRMPGKVSVVWCRQSAVWSQVTRWSFSRPYAEPYRHSQLIERAFTIPTAKEAFARRVLGLPAITRRSTANQLAYYEQLRARWLATTLRSGPDYFVTYIAPDTFGANRTAGRTVAPGSVHRTGSGARAAVDRVSSDDNRVSDDERPASAPRSVTTAYSKAAEVRACRMSQIGVLPREVEI